MVQLRLPMLFNLRSDPFERAQHEAGEYVKWFIEHAFVCIHGNTGDRPFNSHSPMIVMHAAKNVICIRVMRS